MKKILIQEMLHRLISFFLILLFLCQLCISVLIDPYCLPRKFAACVEDIKIWDYSYVVDRPRNRYSYYNIDIHFPQLECNSCSNAIKKVNILLRDAAFSCFGYGSYEDTIVQLENGLVDPDKSESGYVSYDILHIDENYVSVVFEVIAFGGLSMHWAHHMVTVDLQTGEQIYFNDIMELDSLLKLVQDRWFDVYEGTYSELRPGDVYDAEYIDIFIDELSNQMVQEPHESYDRFDPQNIGMDEKYLYIYFKCYYVAFHNYFIIRIPR